MGLFSQSKNTQTSLVQTYDQKTVGDNGAITAGPGSNLTLNSGEVPKAALDLLSRAQELRAQETMKTLDFLGATRSTDAGLAAAQAATAQAAIAGLTAERTAQAETWESAVGKSLPVAAGGLALLGLALVVKWWK